MYFAFALLPIRSSDAFFLALCRALHKHPFLLLLILFEVHCDALVATAVLLMIVCMIREGGLARTVKSIDKLSHVALSLHLLVIGVVRQHERLLRCRVWQL